MTSPTVKLTPTQVRDKEVAHLGTKGLPAAWWTLPAGTDCIGFQMWVLGLRAANDYEPHWISISAFRAWAKWVEVPPVSIKAGDLVLEEWPDLDADGHEKPMTGVPGHMEYCYSVDHDAKPPRITTISANTGPKPGVPTPRGTWKKTRDLDHHFLKGIRIPYADEKPSSSRKDEVRAVAKYLNALHLGKESAAANDGIEGEIYWWEVQTWGRKNGAYPKSCIIDGIPGKYTRAVETVVYKLAKHG